jgi:hypothetical protein
MPSSLAFRKSLTRVIPNALTRTLFTTTISLFTLCYLAKLRQMPGNILKPRGPGVDTLSQLLPSQGPLA